MSIGVSKTSDGALMVSGTMQLSGSNLVEQKTEGDLSSGSVTFAAPVGLVEILNRDSTNDGTFTVNGINVIVPKAPVGGFTSTGVIKVIGTASASIAVTGSTAFIINRRS